jgi:hypothetical protein
MNNTENPNNKIQLFEDRQIRALWDETYEKWWFSVVDIIAVLTESIDSAAYWRKLKQRLKEEGNKTVTICHGLKLLAQDDKMRLNGIMSSTEKPNNTSDKGACPLVKTVFTLFLSLSFFACVNVEAFAFSDTLQNKFIPTNDSGFVTKEEGLTFLLANSLTDTNLLLK